MPSISTKIQIYDEIVFFSNIPLRRPKVTILLKQVFTGGYMAGSGEPASDYNRNAESARVEDCEGNLPDI